MKKLLFVSTSLGGGGAERVLLYLVNYFSNKQKYKIILLLLKKDGNNYLNNVSDNVEVINLNVRKRLRFSIPVIYKSIKQINPDLCYVGLNGLNLLLSLVIPFFNSKIKFVARETNILTQVYRKHTFIYKLLYRYFYNNYHSVIAQSDDMQHDIVSNFGVHSNLVTKINNPVDIDYINCLMNKSLDVDLFKNDIFNFVAVGKLSYQKGYDILFKRISENRDLNIHVFILGTGAEKSDLKKMVNQYKINDKISFLGFVDNPHKYMKFADGLLLSSRYEGFPNVLLEANLCGIPVFVNNCKGGINEIVKDGVNGIITDIEDSSEFRRDIIRFMNFRFHKSKIMELSMLRYSKDIIMPKFAQLFSRILNN